MWRRIRTVSRLFGFELEVICRFVGRFIPRSQRLRDMGDMARKFTNVFVKNFGEEIDDEKLKVTIIISEFRVLR